MIKNTGQKKISETMVTKPDITKRQEQLLEELNKCEDELSGQELHRQLIESGKAMGLTTVYRNLQVLIKHGLIRSRHLPTGEVLYTHEADYVVLNDDFNVALADLRAIVNSQRLTQRLQSKRLTPVIADLLG